MILKIKNIWSPDLQPPSEGVPEDSENFNIFIQVSIGEVGKEGSEVFDFVVLSPSILSQFESGRFIRNTLVLEQFNWEFITNRIEKLLRHCSSCSNWDDVIQQLSGFINYSDG